MGRQVFTAGEILTAANMNDLGDATVMVFDDATDRATAIPTPVEGMVTYLKDTDEVDKFDGSAFVPVGIAPAILQVVSTTLTTKFTSATSAYADVTGLSVSITPSSASSKILILASLVLTTATNGEAVFVRLVRDATPIFVGDAAGSRLQASAGHKLSADQVSGSSAPMVLDSPSTVSAVTYKVQISAGVGSAFAVVGSQGTDSDNGNHGRYASSITAMEVAG